MSKSEQINAFERLMYVDKMLNLHIAEDSILTRGGYAS